MHEHLRWSRDSTLPSLLLLGLLGVGCAGTGKSAAAVVEIEAIRAADQAYADAWLGNDPEAVMATLTEDSVLMPSGTQALVGARAAREFWWPEGGAPTIVSEFTLVQEEAGGSDDLGFVRGSFTLGFDYDGKTYRSGGDYLSVLRRTPAGWRLSHRAWSDLWRIP